MFGVHGTYKINQRPGSAATSWLHVGVCSASPVSSGLFNGFVNPKP